MSYYGYVERKPEEMQVDWASVTKGISDSLSEWQKGREDLKEKLEKEARETAKAIGETPEVRDEPTQTFVLGAANTAASRLNELNKQLKSNKITPKEYTLRRSNIQSDMNEFYTFVKSFDKAYLAKEQRVNDNKSGVVERVVTEEALKKLEGGLGGLKPEVDETGTLIFKSEDGKTSTSMREMMKLGSFQYNKKNSLDEMMKLGKQMAAVQKGLASSSRVNDEAMNTINRQIDAILLNSNDVADVLEDAGVKKDWKVNNFKVEITETDKEKAREILREAALSAMGTNIEKASTGGGSGKESTQREKDSFYFGQALKDPTNKANAALIAKELNVAKVEYNGTILTITDKDGSKTTQNVTPNELPDVLTSISGLDQQYVKQGFGGATKMGAFSGGAGVGKKPAVQINVEAEKDGGGNTIEPTPQQLQNKVIDMKRENPSYSEDFKYEDGKVKIRYKNDSGQTVWGAADTIKGLNQMITKWNQQNAQ